jgi:hypothetical protein
MPSQGKIEEVASALLSTKDFNLISIKTLQSLWAGYGHICRVHAHSIGEESAKTRTSISMILKYINPPPVSPNRPPDEGHLRKILSYQIEQFFYTKLATSMPEDINVASCLASIDTSSGGTTTAMLLSDLREAFPRPGEKRAELSKIQVYAAINWLASFHGFWWNRAKDFDRSSLCRPPLEHFETHRTSVLQTGNVWLNGGYTYLATRRTEYESLASDVDSQWSTALCTPLVHLKGSPSLAELVATFLSPSPENATAGPISQYETLIHGDVKSENLFTTERGDQVAFYDFQYVGLGLGVCDLAKLFTCSVPLELLGDEFYGSDGEPAPMAKAEETLLRSYLDTLQHVSGRKYEWKVFVRHWETALVDWLRFQASWGFWGNTMWLESRVRYILKDDGWKKWLEAQVAGS